ncbi:hypothetical protein CA850_29835 [Micromonospora echinospora]|nr:hypothetical protein CA850_29835 [Micromonospora echinospora]
MAVVLGGVVALGCGGGGGDTGKVTDVSQPKAAASSAAPEKKTVAAMGAEAVTLDGGVVVTVGKPTKFTPSGTSAGHQRGNSAAVFSITIENKGTEPLDLTLANVTASFGAEGTQAEPVFDSEKGITGGFTSTIATGQKRTAKYAFSAPTKDTSVIAVTVEPNALGDSVALFEGKL